MYRLFPSKLAGREEKTITYGEFDFDEFADLVNRTYDAKDLYKWTPTKPMPSDPDAPGNLGTIKP